MLQARVVCAVVSAIVLIPLVPDARASGLTPEAPLAWVVAAKTGSNAGAPASHPDSARAGGLFSRDDLWFWLASSSVIVAAGTQDRWLTEVTTDAHTQGELNLARDAQPLGNPAYLLPALALVYGAARLAHRPALARSSMRIGVSIGCAGAMALALKEVVGRARPVNAPDDPWRFRPFSSDHSFPSGHATVAFAAAAALDRETRSRWVWAAYPVAAWVGWSRVHQQEHWTSDVVAGAAIGIWTARKAETLARRGTFRRFGIALAPSRGGARATLAARF